MARTIRTKVYKFNELTEDAKQKAIEKFRYSNTLDYEFAWDDIKEDALQIGLKITSLDDHRQNTGSFKHSAIDCANSIINEHGNLTRRQTN